MDPFFRAYVATLYLCDVKGPALVALAGEHASSPLVRALTSGDRSTRAAMLANEVAKLAVALADGALA